jgi:hypothetical protein
MGQEYVIRRERFTLVHLAERDDEVVLDLAHNPVAGI